MNSSALIFFLEAAQMFLRKNYASKNYVEMRSLFGTALVSLTDWLVIVQRGHLHLHLFLSQSSEWIVIRVNNDAHIFSNFSIIPGGSGVLLADNHVIGWSILTLC